MYFRPFILMNKKLKILLRVLFGIFGVLILFIVGFLVFVTMTEYDPPGVAPAEAGKGGISIDKSQRRFTFLTWNIGYAGLSSEMNFFYDGGTMVRPPREGFEHALKGIRETIANYDTMDFIFLQEIDRRAKRSYHTDILGRVAEVVPKDFWAFGKNYDVRYVPVPLGKPMGCVVSGLAAFSPFRPDTAQVFSLKTNFSWPKSTVILKRTILVMKYKMDEEKELVVINLHNSAFDSGGLVRKRELGILQGYMQSEFKKGNWVIAGGDWNDNPRGFDSSMVKPGDPVFKIKPPIGSDFLPGWEFVFDPYVASNRNVDDRYIAGVTRTTTIDFFVISPNVAVVGVKTIPTGFAFSDHNPVIMVAELQ